MIPIRARRHETPQTNSSMIAQMRILSLNCNGLRSAIRKGFYEWLPSAEVDVVCLQETRLGVDKVTDDLQCLGYHGYWQHAVKPGYSGVAVLSRIKPDDVIEGFGSAEFDPEGRYVEVRFKSVSVASVYLPSGSSGDVRQAAKYRSLDEFRAHCRRLLKAKRSAVLCGDFNIAHKPIDIKNWKGNLKNSGFLPEERAWLDQLFDEDGWVDAFRVVNSEADQYTWWSNRGQAYAKNVGWRIDYQMVSPDLKAKIRRAEIYKAQKFSDHAPLLLDYDLKVPSKGGA